MNDIRALIDRYRDKVTALEKQTVEAKRILESALEVYRLLQEEGLSVGETSLSKQVAKSDNKYANANMTEAIKDVLTNYPKANAKEVFTELQRNGFKRDSKTLQRDVYIKLYKLEKTKKIVATREGKDKKRYSVAE